MKIHLFVYNVNLFLIWDELFTTIGTMTKYDVPKKPERKYDTGNKQVVSIRLPESMIKRLNKELKDKGYSQTELIELILDQYFQHVDKK